MIDIRQIFNQHKRKILAVDFNQAAIEIAYLESQSGQFKLLAWDVKKISFSQDKEEAIAQLISDFRKKNNINTRSIFVGLSDADAVSIKHLVLPVLPQEEILEAAKWQLKDEVHFDLSEAILDWQVVRDYTDDEGVKRSGMIFIMAKRGAVEKCLSIASHCGLYVLGIGTAPFNHLNILKRLEQNLPVVAILNIGHKDSALSIYTHNQLSLIRELPFSKEKFIQSLTGVLVTDKGKIELSLKDAEYLAHTVGIPQDKNEVIRDNVYGGHVISLVRPLLEVLTREAKFSFDYFSQSFDASRPTFLYLAGPGVGIKNLDTYLAKELNIKLTPLPLPKTVGMGSLTIDNHNEIASALGLGLEVKCAVDLLPPEIKEARSELFVKALVRAGTLFLTGIFLLSMFALRFQVQDYSKRLNIASIHLATIGDIETLKERIASRENLAVTIQQDEIVVEGILKALSTLTPSQVVLDAMSFSKANHHLEIRGKVFAKEEAAEAALTNFIQQLEASPFFVEISLLSSRTSEAGQDFELSCDLAHE